MTLIRKAFFKRLIYIGLGIIPIIFFWEQKGSESFFPFAGFIFIVYQFIMISVISPQIINDFFPPVTSYEFITKPFDKFAQTVVTIFFLLSNILLIFESRRIENTIGGMKLFWNYSLIGILIASAITMILKFTNPSVYYQSGRRYRIYFGLFLGFFFLTPTTGSFVNHYFSDSEVACNKYRIISKSIGNDDEATFWLKLQINGHDERFEVTRKIWNEVKESGLIILCTQKGRLGYDFVSEFKTMRH